MEMDLAQKNKILQEMSSLDGLTKISNHRTLVEHLKACISDAVRTGSPMSIAIFDIDDFKKVNDTRGHVFGDQVLARVAAIINGSIRGADLAGRYGGEEFMVLFPDTGLEQAAKVSERIRQVIADYAFEEGMRVTVSGGVKQYTGETPAELIHAADIRLYQAKKNGKNQIVF